MPNPRLTNVLLLLVLLTGLGLLFLFALPRLVTGGSPGRIRSTPTIVQQVQTLSQLVTVKYVIEKVVILEDVKWFGESRVLMVAHGVVKAGVNLAEIKPQDIRVSGNKISIKLPPARVSDAYLDDRQTQVVERTTGLLRSFDKDLEQNARQQAVADINLAAREEGILKDASERARTQLIQLFHQLGYDQVEIRQ